MISRTYTVQDEKEVVGAYKGFDRDYTKSKLSCVCLVLVEDQIEVFALDGHGALPELRRYFQESGDAPVVQVLGVYDRVMANSLGWK